MRRYYRTCLYLARVLCSSFLNVRFFGREHVPLEGPVLLVSNHQSFLDPALCSIGLERELDFMARETLFRTPLFGPLIHSLNAFPVQPGQGDIRAVRTIIERLHAGRAVLLYPEGTRSEDGRIRIVRRGFELIARRGNATIVPMVVEGAYDAWPRGQLLPKIGSISVMYGEALAPGQIRQTKPAQLVEMVNGRMREMQNHLRQRRGQAPYNYDDA